MSVYVDSLGFCVPNARWRYTESCHLVADSLEELHSFATRLGLKREWFQDKRLPHYDLTKGKRALAVRLGAVEIKFGELVRFLRSRDVATLLGVGNYERRTRCGQGKPRNG
jgi:hypothetical protein